MQILDTYRLYRCNHAQILWNASVKRTKHFSHLIKDINHNGKHVFYICFSFFCLFIFLTHSLAHSHSHSHSHILHFILFSFVFQLKFFCFFRLFFLKYIVSIWITTKKWTYLIKKETLIYVTSNMINIQDCITMDARLKSFSIQRSKTIDNFF